jgi:hypothetical protein
VLDAQRRRRSSEGCIAAIPRAEVARMNATTALGQAPKFDPESSALYEFNESRLPSRVLIIAQAKQVGAEPKNGA